MELNSDSGLMAICKDQLKNRLMEYFSGDAVCGVAVCLFTWLLLLEGNPTNSARLIGIAVGDYRRKHKPRETR